MSCSSKNKLIEHYQDYFYLRLNPSSTAQKAVFSNDTRHVVLSIEIVLNSNFFLQHMTLRYLFTCLQ